MDLVLTDNKPLNKTLNWLIYIALIASMITLVYGVLKYGDKVSGETCSYKDLHGTTYSGLDCEYVKQKLDEGAGCKNTNLSGVKVNAYQLY